MNQLLRPLVDLIAASHDIAREIQGAPPEFERESEIQQGIDAEMEEALWNLDQALGHVEEARRISGEE